MDIKKTVNYYRKLDKNSLCSCDYCRNYCLGIKKTYPILSDYLTGMGVDIEKPFETMPLDPYEGIIEYIAVQYIVMGNHSDFKAAVVSGVDIDMADSYPVTSIEEEHFVIEISPIKLKWAL